MENLNVTTLTRTAVCALQGGVSTVMASLNMSSNDSSADARRSSAGPHVTMPNLTMLNPLAASGLLESFIPQYSLFASFVRDFLGLDLGLVMAGCLALYSISGTAQYLFSSVWGFVASHYTAQIIIRDEDEIFNHVMAWLNTQRLTTNNTRLTAETDYQLPEDEEPDTNADGFINFASWWRRSVPRFAPAHGAHWFKHSGRYFELSRSRRDFDEVNPWGGSRTRAEETLVISCLGRSTDPIKRLLMDCKDAYYAREITNTDIHRPTAGMGSKGWDMVASRRSRPIETVVLDAKQKREVLADMDEFLRPTTATWYAERGIPYRRGYLFHGPPGTGKTSLSFAAAGLFGLDVYCLSLVDPTMTEEDLVSLFSQLPSRCIVLLEDVDTAGLAKRTGLSGADAKKEVNSKSKSSKKKGSSGADSDSDSDSDDDAHGMPDRAAKRGSGITLSGLLNAIDGVASHEGRLLVMTTNKPSALDAALRRPGRVDKEVAFAHASRAQIADLFARMYAGTAAGEVRGLADKFAAVLEDGVWSPAEIQGFLLTHKKEPHVAVAEVGAWRLEQLEGKKSAKEKKEDKAKKEAEEKKAQDELDRKARINSVAESWVVPWIAAF